MRVMLAGRCSPSVPLRELGAYELSRIDMRARLSGMRLAGHVLGLQPA